MHASPVSTRCRLLWLCLLLPPFLWASSARAAEVTWTGAVDSSWSTAGNWDGGVPGQDDIAVVPLTANQPEVGAADTVCVGVVLEEDATLRVLDSGSPSAPYGLYIIGAGDLDGDGVSDARERDESLGAMSFDADGDGIPNFAETDSDNDGLQDACEFAYIPELQPYFYNDPEADTDSDGHTDAEECAEGTDPTDPDSFPVPMPLLRTLGLGAVVLALLALSVRVLRKAGPRTRRVLSVLLVAALLPLGGYVQPLPLLAASLSVDFALMETVEGVASTATPGDTLEIYGASVRPWNGQSTYVNNPLTLQAVGGPVFLGGMRAAFNAGVLGEGSLGVASSYAGVDHPAPVSSTVLAGSVEAGLFLGERVTLTPEPATGWGFHGWANDASGSANPLGFQALADGLRATAVFGPPGPDLAPTLDTGPTSVLYAGDTVAADFQIENIGQSDTLESAWDDGLYLSRDAAFDAEDLALDVNAHSGAVDAGDDYTASFSATLPDVAPGRYYLLGVADVGREATDANRNNNVVAVSVTVLDFNLAQ